MIAIIKIPDHYKNIPQDYYDLPDAVRNGTILPDNATNGDVIKALWNVSEDDIDIGFSTVYLYTNTRVFNGHQDRERIFFNKDWWNAPYRKEAEQR